MVHLGRSLVSSLMLAVAFTTTIHVGMKRGRLTLEQRLIVGMTGNTAAGFNTLDGCVTSRAVVLQKRVRLGQFSWQGHSLPGRFAQDAGRFAPGMTPQEVIRAK